MNMIEVWLKSFTKYWNEKNVEKVLELFTDDVEYWETPYTKIPTISALREEWAIIHEQHNIDIKCEVFSVSDNKYTVHWDLNYTNILNEQVHYKGVYLIKLNRDNKCNYFFHCGEKE